MCQKKQKEHSVEQNLTIKQIYGKLAFGWKLYTLSLNRNDANYQLLILPMEVHSAFFLACL